MNPHEEAIDKVLAALRDAPVPQHLDRRILNSIEEAHQSQRNTFFGNIIPNEAPRGRSPGIPAFPATRTALACCAVLALAALTLTHFKRNTTPANTATSPINANSPAPLASSTVSIPPSAPRTPQSSSAKAHGLNTPHSANVTSHEDHAAISHPAPPLPLTEQERLLLRVAHRGHPNDLAQYTSERQAAQVEQEKAEYLAFFEPPKTGESE
jgi:cytoskeletal protein RodZ